MCPDDFDAPLDFTEDVDAELAFTVDASQPDFNPDTPDNMGFDPLLFDLLGLSPVEGYHVVADAEGRPIWAPDSAAGPVGPTGPTGPQGPQGIQGMSGTDGEDGPQGFQGPVGPQGNVGTTGPQGPIGIPGPAGDDGIDGPPGPVGATGTTGPAGPVGIPGPPGEEGPWGPPGPTGSTGARGERGPAMVPEFPEPEVPVQSPFPGLGAVYQWDNAHTFRRSVTTVAAADSSKGIELTHNVSTTADNSSGTHSGLRFTVEHAVGAHTVQAMTGISGSVSQSIAAATATIAQAVSATVQTDEGTITTGKGLLATVSVSGGTITTGIGVDIARIQTSGTFTTGIGLRIQAVSGTIGTDIAIQSLGGQNRFVGNVKIGADSAPAHPLDVVGVGLFTGQVRHANHAVRAVGTGTQAITPGAVAAVSFTAADAYDTGGLHDTATNPSRLTAVVAGRYHVTGGILWEAAAISTTTFLMIRLSKNGVVIEGSRLYFPPISSLAINGQGMTTACDINLAAGDYVECEVFFDAGAANRNIQRANSSFQMHYIGE